MLSGAYSCISRTIPPTRSSSIQLPKGGDTRRDVQQFFLFFSLSKSDRRLNQQLGLTRRRLLTGILSCRHRSSLQPPLPGFFAGQVQE